MKMIRLFITASIQPLIAFICLVAFALMTLTLHGKDHQPMKTLFEFISFQLSVFKDFCLGDVVPPE